MITANELMTDFDHYMKKFGALYTEELQIEDEAKAQAELSLQKAMEQARQDREAGQTKLGQKFVGYAYENCRDNIQALLESIKHPKKTTQGEYRPLYEKLLSIFEDKEEELEDILVLTGISKSIDCVCASKNTFSEISLAIGTDIKEEAEVEDFFNFEAEKGVDLKWLKKSLEQGIETRVRKSYKVAYAVNRMHKEGYEGLGWSKADCQVVGMKVLEMIVAGSGYWEEVDKETTKGKKVKALVMSEWFEKAWQTNAEKLLANAVHCPPMVIPPRDWQSPWEGGYYGASTLHSQLVRMHSGKSNKFMDAYKHRLEMVDMPIVYSALNAMQSTPFAINPFILNVIKEIIEAGGELGGIPRMEPIEMPAKLPEGTSEDELKAHKKKLVGIYKREEARKSKALRTLTAYQTAEKFSKYDKVYFPWNIDYRGRCYPIPTALNPQGDDIQKSLLLFANKNALPKEDSYRWLYIHTSNLAGHDKISFADRVQWVEDNMTNIIASAEDPLGYRWWYDESKNDYPMEFLAACNEIKSLHDYMEANGSCVGFESGLPLAFDGTCSGLQHFSGLLHDEVGGHAVNLTPTDTVQDIYSIVAEKVNKVLLKDALSGTEDKVKTNKDGSVVYSSAGEPSMTYGTKTLAQNWVSFNRIKYGKDGITRKVCKRSVMTLAYGSKQYGFKENLLADIIMPFVMAHPQEIVFINTHQAAQYMAKLIWEAVGTTVIKAVEGMAWLQEVAGLICSNDRVVLWQTPNGLPVQQNYMKEKQITKRLRYNKTQIRLYSQQATDEVDSKSQRNGIAPNFIHSMDACHLQRVVVAEAEKGNTNFMMIHDSFGTDCAHAESLYHTIREQFVELYADNNWLEDFRNQIEYLLPEDAEVPELPSYGNLDVSKVLESDFCFA